MKNNDSGQNSQQKGLFVSVIKFQTITYLQYALILNLLNSRQNSGSKKKS